MSTPRSTLTPEEIRTHMMLMNDPLAREITAALLESEEDNANPIEKDVAEGPLPVSNIDKRRYYPAHEAKVSPISHDNNDSRPLEKVKFENLGLTVTTLAVAPYLNKQELECFFASNRTLYNQKEQIPNILKKNAFRQYLEAAIFDDASTISRILESYPDFILAEPKDYGIKQIKCRYTGLQHLTEGSVFSIAQQLRHVNAIEAMLPYYDLQLGKMHDDKSRTELENMWILQSLTEAEQKKLQDEYIKDLLLPIITAIAADTTFHVKINKIETTNETTLNALKAFKDKVFKPKAIKDCIDVDQFLFAANNVYFQNVPKFNFWQKAFATEWIIGLSQNLVGRGLAETFCQGLISVVYGKRPIDDDARSLRIFTKNTKTFFYRLLRDDRYELDSFYLACRVDKPKDVLFYTQEYPIELCQTKKLKCDELIQDVHNTHQYYRKYRTTTDTAIKQSPGM